MFIKEVISVPKRKKKQMHIAECKGLIEDIGPELLFLPHSGLVLSRVCSLMYILGLRKGANARRPAPDCQKRVVKRSSDESDSV